ncbi:PadR family transcriptional regulator [Asticcacaulis sp. 201]|uniref:PadR family transcriptional regulator n=1 Tax=Asticcacaulis sp. 201 TaxID=3028787 RepID=UPI002915F9B7|nr:PadR family transcriptional regulator [Asticcacaulis sp. 201]MDV6329602.1 PadR family transcriptional regulator [Asticcacaulis sp. 201]
MKRNRTLSAQALTVLAALLAAGNNWCHGYELAKQANIKSGTLYPLLIRLESQGYLEAVWQEATETGRPPRHAYRLTASGKQLARHTLGEAGAVSVKDGGGAIA